MIWPFSRISAWLEWRRRDREEVTVATVEYTTHYSNEGKETGMIARHMLVLYRDGNGVRYSSTTTSDKFAADAHSYLVRDQVLWRIHGTMPGHALLCKNKHSREMFTVIDGGAA